MKSLKLFGVILLFLLINFNTMAQDKIQTPKQNEIIKARIKNEEYEMNWFGVRDTMKIEIGKVLTRISKTDKSLKITTIVKMKNNPDWIDESIAELPDLNPITHTSVNTQREILLNFGKVTTGYYEDKIGKQKIVIEEKTEGDFFDSNLYPQLIRWLPLKENYTTALTIFDYNPKSTTGIIKASVTGTKKGVYNAKPVWIVNVTDDISQNKVINTYYIDAENYQILKQEIDMGTRKMIMEKI
jgi:hypothetical protein